MGSWSDPYGMRPCAETASPGGIASSGMQASASRAAARRSQAPAPKTTTGWNPPSERFTTAVAALLARVNSSIQMIQTLPTSSPTAPMPAIRARTWSPDLRTESSSRIAATAASPAATTTGMPRGAAPGGFDIPGAPSMATVHPVVATTVGVGRPKS